MAVDFRKFDGRTHHYGVSTKYGHNGSKSISYVLSCTYNVIGEFVHVQLERKTFFINGEDAKTLIDRLARDCMELLYPLEVKINHRGAFLEFSNRLEMLERAQKKISEIRQAYKGEVVNLFLSQMNRAFQSDEALTEAMMKDPLYSVLFFVVDEQDVTPQRYMFPHGNGAHTLDNFFGEYYEVPDKKFAKGVAFKGQSRSDSKLDIQKYHYFEDGSIEEVLLSVVESSGERMDYRITRLLEREHDTTGLYEKEEDKTLKNVKPHKKKKKWIFY